MNCLFFNSLAAFFSTHPIRNLLRSDNDCASGLFCFERNGLEAIPGCIGSGQNQFDYCYNPGSGFERLTFFGNLDYDYYELGQCEGGTIFNGLQLCILHTAASHSCIFLSAEQTVISIVTVRLDLFVMSEKAVTMAAFQRALVTLTLLALEMMIFASRGQAPTFSSVFTRTKLAVMPLVGAFFRFHDVPATVILVSDHAFRCSVLSFNFLPVSHPFHLLVSDIDCLPGLSCYQRSGFNAVPGCSGTGEEDFDYCI